MLIHFIAQYTNDMCTPFAHTLLKAFHFTAMKRDEAIFLRSISLSGYHG